MVQSDPKALPVLMVQLAHKVLLAQRVLKALPVQMESMEQTE
jgi:hypothetical protein